MCRVGWVVLVCLSLLGGCAGPAAKNEAFARQQGWQRLWVVGSGFRHRVYLHQGMAPARTWHVYIEGDGRPWSGRYQVASNPAVAQPLLLRLAAMDDASVIYLGRPCYQYEKMPRECEPWVWTQGRYSGEVVDSMLAALSRLRQDYAIDKITLIGHSGGATLAMLMAHSLPSLDVLVTLSGNLDTKLWVEQHGYTPLTGSFNPITQAWVREPVRQFHYFGARDQNIPVAELVEELMARWPAANIQVKNCCGHRQGWLQEWPVIMNELEPYW